MRKLLALILYLIALPLAARSAEIVSPYPAGCSDVSWYTRAYRMAQAGDRVALERFINESVADGTCIRWKTGLKVRIEETRLPHVCVAPMGSTEPCRWLESREVKP